MCHPTSDREIDVYLAIIDYKRSIGRTQWAVFSIFVTASTGMFLFTLGHDVAHPLAGRAVALAVYLIGFLSYRRYRMVNRAVQDYLMALEATNGYRFQTSLCESVHRANPNSEHLLLIGLFVYIGLTLVVSLA